MSDPIHNPAHYTQYPVQPIEISRHLGFCLGNALKYVMRAPFKGGVEDCDKAAQYLAWERETPQPLISVVAWHIINDKISQLIDHLINNNENGIRREQALFLEALAAHVGYPEWADSNALLFRVERLKKELEAREGTS